MAKKENREGVALQCTVCKEINYLTSKNIKNDSIQDCRAVRKQTYSLIFWEYSLATGNSYKITHTFDLVIICLVTYQKAITLNRRNAICTETIYCTTFYKTENFK